MNVYMFAHMCGDEKERDRRVQRPLNPISKLMVLFCLQNITQKHMNWTLGS